MSLLYLVDGIAATAELYDSVEYLVLTMPLFGLVWYISHRLVGIGARIGEQEQSGVRYYSKIIVQQVN